MSTSIVGALVLLSPLAIASGFAAHRLAARLPTSAILVTIASAGLILIACVTGLLTWSHRFDTGEDMLGLSLLITPLLAIGSMVVLGVIAGSAIGIRSGDGAPR